MTLTYNEEDDNYIYTITEENEYSRLLSNHAIPINIDSTNFNFNTCDSIFEQVFAFVNENYIDIDPYAEFYTLHTGNKGQSDNLLNILKKKATDTLQTQMNKKMTGVVDNALHKNIFNGLKDVATDTLQTLMDEKMTDLENNALHKNIFNGLNDVATDTLQNQINALPKNETAELGVIDKEQYKDDSKEYGKPLDLDKDKTKLTITINDPDNKNKKTKQQLTVKEIIDNLKQNKVPNNNPSRKYNNPKKESEKYKSKNYKKKKLIEALTNANTVGQAITILKDRQYNVDPKYNQYYNEFINTLYGRHPFSGGDNMDIENEI
jgi:hypothetical protein